MCSHGAIAGKGVLSSSGGAKRFIVSSLFLSSFLSARRVFLILARPAVWLVACTKVLEVFHGAIAKR